MTVYYVPQLILGKLNVHVGGTRIDVAEFFLHHMQRGALRDHLGIAQLRRTYARV